MILVRHARPKLDPAVDCADWGLSADGRARSRLLADRLRRFAPGAVYSSPEPKALATAEIVGTTLGLGVAEILELREHDRTGVPFFSVPGEFEERMSRLFEHQGECVFGTESAAAALARFRHGINRVLSPGNRQPLVFTHGTVMSLYIAAETGLDAAEIWRELSMPCYVVFSEESRSWSGVEHVTP